MVMVIVWDCSARRVSKIQSGHPLANQRTAVAVYVTPLKVKAVAAGQTVVRTLTVVVTQVSLAQAETDAARPATTASFPNCISTDLGGIKSY